MPSLALSRWLGLPWPPQWGKGTSFVRNCQCCSAPSSPPSAPIACCGLGTSNLHATASGPAATTHNFTGGNATVVLTRAFGGWSGLFTDSVSHATFPVHFECDKPCVTVGNTCTDGFCYTFFFENQAGTCGLDPVDFCSNGTTFSPSVAATIVVQCVPFSIAITGIDTCTGKSLTVTITL